MIVNLTCFHISLMSSSAIGAERVDVSDDDAKEMFDSSITIAIVSPGSSWNCSHKKGGFKAKPDLEQLFPWRQTMADIWVKTKVG